MALREILIELGIEVDDKDAEKVIDNVRQGLLRMAKAEQKARTGLKNFTSNIVTAKNAAIGFGTVLATGAVAKGFAAVTVEAGDAAETINKFNAVFVQNANTLSDSLTEMAVRTGQSITQLKALAADAGSFIRPLVGSSEATADFSQQLTETILDISSFENVLPERALMALRSALIGESEPMLRFGVDTRVAALQQFALSKGITKSTKDMKAQEITALRMQLIMQRLGEKGAVGDATRTAGSFTNRLRGMRGALKDLRIEIGNQFLPMATEAIKAITDFARSFSPTMSNAVSAVIDVMQGFAGLIQGLLFPFKRLDTAILAFVSTTLLALGLGFKIAGAQAVLAAVKFGLMSIPMLLVTGLMVALLAVIALVIEDLFRMGEGGESVFGTMATGIDELVMKWGDLGTAIGEMLDEALRFWLKFFGKTSEETDDWVENLTDTLFEFWPNVLNFWEKAIKDFFIGIFDSLESLAVFTADLFGVDFETPRRGPRAGARQTAGAGVLAQTVGAVATAANQSVPLSPAIAAPTTAATSGPTLINQPNNQTTISVDASGQSDPAAIGNAVAEAMRAENERRDRNTQAAFTVASGGG